MTSGYSTASLISAFVLTVWEAAVESLRQTNVMLDRVTVFDDRSGTATRTTSQFGTLTTFGTVGESDDLVPEYFSRTQLQSLTPYEYAKQVFVTDLEIETDPEAYAAQSVKELGVAAARGIETNLTGLMASLTGGTIGAAGTTVTWGHVYAGVTRLRNAGVTGPLTYVMTMYQYHALARAISPAALSLASVPEYADMSRPFAVARLDDLDLTLVATNSIAVDGSDDAYGGIFARDAIAFDWRRRFRLARQRDESRRGTELNASMVYAYGLWRPEKGVRMLFDSAAPTS